MRPITPASPEQGQAIANAVERLREARTLLRQAGARQHALAVLDEAFVFEVAVAIDQHQAASSAGSSSRGNSGVGAMIR